MEKEHINTNDFIKKLTRYYKATLETEEFLKFKFKNEHIIELNSDLKDKNDYLIFGIKNLDIGKKTLEYCSKLIDKMNTPKGEKKPKYNKKFEDLFEAYYAPLTIKINGTFIPPFLIKLSNDQDIKKVLESFYSKEYEKNVFNGSEVIVNPALMVEPFELVDYQLNSKVLNRLEKKNKGMRVDNLLQLKSLLVDAINSWLFSEYEDEKISLERSEKGVYFAIEELLKKQILIDKNKKLESVSNPHIIIKNLENTDDNVNINGFIKAYSSLENLIKKDAFDKKDLLFYFLEGSQEKYLAVPPLEKINDNHSLVLDYAKILEYTRLHRGALTKDYDLTASQKYCLNASKSNLKVIPVNGPPGTGKTSLLRALVGDIITSNAINSYNNYLKNKEIYFSTPIVSFSTNNKALENVADGMSEIFESLKKSKSDNFLFQRWLNPHFEYSFYENKKRKVESTTLFDTKIYAPLFKSSSNIDFKNPKSTIINWDSINSIMNSINGNYVNLIKDYVKNFNSLKLGFEIPLENILEFKENSLEMVLEYLNIEMNRLINLIDKKISKVDIDTNYQIFKKVLNEILLFQKSENINIQTKEQLKIYLNHLHNKINLFNSKYSEIENKINKLRNKFENKMKDIEEDYSKAIELIEEEYLITLSNQDKKLMSSIDNEEKRINSLLEKKLKIKNKKIENLEIRYKKLSLLKIRNIFTKEKESQENEILDEFEKEKEIIMISFDNSKTKISVNIEERRKNLEKSKNNKKDTVFNNYKEEKEIIKKEFEESIREEEKKYKEAFILFQLQELSHEEALNKIEYFKKLVDKLSSIDVVFFADFNSRLQKQFEGDDLNIRTKITFYALHILEGLLLIDVMKNIELNKKNKQVSKCFNPSCGNITLSRVFEDGDKIKYVCQTCGAQFVNNEVKKIGRRLSKDEVVRILTYRTVYIDNLPYSLVENTQNKGKYWNVAQCNYIYSNDKIELLKKSSVLFPVLNTTCHSFGTMFSIDNENFIPQGLINDLFVDEAGMILPHYMINLIAGKRVFLFGDETQIEPVYPFSKDEKLAEKIFTYLKERYFDNNDEKKKVLDFYAVECSNAMKIGKNSTLIENPMYKIDLDGDLWLLEHFRCSESIASYCNEMFYGGYMNLMKKNDEKKCHLKILNHEYESKKHKGSKSKYNNDEIDSILNNIKEKLVDKNEDEKEEFLNSVGIVTPYKDQENELKKKLEHIGYEKIITYGTVHKFQGSEKDIIYFSTTVGINNTSASDTFMINKAQPNIINVAVSRAKEEFILVGNKKNLELVEGSYTQKLVSHIEEYEKSLLSNE